MAKENSCGAVVFKRHKDGIKYLLLHYGAGHWIFLKENRKKMKKKSRHQQGK